MTLSRVQGVQLHRITPVKRTSDLGIGCPYLSPLFLVTKVSLQCTGRDGENLSMSNMTAPNASAMPSALDHHEKMRLRAAAFRATRVYPGPVGEILSRELLCWEEFGYRFGSQSLIKKLVDEILKTPLAYPSPSPNDYKGGIPA